MPFDKNFISVIVCTFNRSGLLKKCLDSLSKQDISPERYEVIVVDNGSTDDTPEIVNDYLRRYDNFLCVKEERIGLSHARNRGWKEARGSFVAYIDDDAFAYPDWISSIIAFVERHPEAGLFGGPHDGYTLTAKPEWFPPEYGSLSLGESERPLNVGSEWIIGLNMVIRKELFYQYGGFNESLGMAGGKVAYGEEINLCLLLNENGIPIFYVPSVRISHLIAGYKMSLKWLLSSSYAAGRQDQVIFRTRKPFFSVFVALIITGGIAVWRLLQPVKLPFKRRLYYSFNNLCYQLGVLSECTDNCFKI